MRVLLFALLVASLAFVPACGDDKPADKPGDKPADTQTTTPAPDADAMAAAMDRGRAYLVSQLNEDGSIGKGPEEYRPAMTAMGVLGLIATTPKDKIRGDDAINKAIQYLLPLQDDTGAIIEKTGKRNYITAVFVSALSFARNPEYRKALVAAKDYLQSSQIAGDESDLSYGGFPYKQAQGQPADLSNSKYAFEALKNAERAGEKVDPVVWERAQKLLARFQNRSEVNTGTVKAKIKVDGQDTEVEVVSGNDNGAIYHAGNSKAGYDKRDDGKYTARSYGSMTYALLKCLIWAGVKADDPRVQGAVRWISDNWTTEYNPGFQTAEERMQGYYYYLHTATRALAEYELGTGEPLVVRDANGESHAWRKEMGDQLVALQRDGGFWVNDKDRWEEGSPVIVTSYALQALAFVKNRLP
ncbi:MAG: terpene cyclase/mutase family protein [Planctomycetota bacterium]|nr:terpene cyclase/mutase family protein [Planctomycetota bacterium]